MDTLPPSSSAPTTIFSYRSLHLAALCGFALTQPLLTALIGQPVYLHDQKYGYAEIGVLLAVLLLGLPLAFVLLDQIVLRLSRLLGGCAKNLAIGLLAFLVALSLLRPYVCSAALVKTGCASLLDLAAATLVAFLFAWFYDRSFWLRSWLTWICFGVVLFPVSFLWHFQTILKTEESAKRATPVHNPIPVVFIVFDELSGITLFNQDHEIDSVRFPQFARLAGLSTWYRNTSTVSPRTHLAVPSMLAGRYPVVEREPLEAQYPGNLLQVIASSKEFEMAVFEPMTRICPETVRKVRRIEKSFHQKCAQLLYTMSTVYPRLIFAADSPIPFPAIPREWFTISQLFPEGPEKQLEFSRGLFHFPVAEFRLFQQEHFLRSIEPSAKPPFCFMHLVLPHYPWVFLPSGQQYQSEFGTTMYPAAGFGELGEDWDDDVVNVLRNEHRYRLQLGMVDRFIGQVLDRLKETDLFDDCLLVVAADHGVSFRPGQSRRIPGRENLADIMSVPLFIKFPGQTEPRIDDRNIETIDLYPTIADVLGINLPAEIDGISVREEHRRQRKDIYINGKLTVVDADFPQRWPAVERQAVLYKTGSDEQMTSAACRYPQWHGRALSSFSVSEVTLPYSLFEERDANGYMPYIREPSRTPNLIWGFVATDDVPEIPADILLAVNGVVIDSTRTSRFYDSRYVHEFQFLIPESLLDGGELKKELFLVNSRKPEEPLKRLILSPIRRSPF